MGMYPEHKKILEKFQKEVSNQKPQDFHPDKPYFIPYADLSKPIQHELDEIIKMRRYTTGGAAGVVICNAGAATQIVHSSMLLALPASIGALHYTSWAKRNSLNKIQELITQQRDVVKNRVAHPNLPDAHKIADTHGAGYVAGIERGFPKTGHILFSADDIGIVLCPNTAILEKAKRAASNHFNKDGIMRTGGFLVLARGRFSIEIEPPKKV